MKRTSVAPFTLILLCSLISWASSTSAQFIPGLAPTELENLGDGLYAFRAGGYRNIFLVTSEGVIVTDPLSSDKAKILREQIFTITDQPVKFVAYSHSHWDHVSGGQIFKDEGAKVVAQERCATNIKETPHPDVVPPDITFKEKYSIKLGDHSLDMHYFGPSHDDCMVVMIAKPANMLFVVDIGSVPKGWFMEYNPTMPDDNLHNMPQFLRATEALMAREGVETVVSGHLALDIGDDGSMTPAASTGPAKAIGDKALFWEMLFAFVRDEMERGASVYEAPDRILADKQFQNEFVDKIRSGFEPDEMWILLRRVASYIETGR
ncbi:MAG: MBL fold metallo-hydrolase [Gammaproteobacteria bacterium]|nr:MBL fold metallo-hydrolase [Gammaproteobacteria bacterium]MDP7271776.1 MBL fold metallo-hydrolase [Gammaproteobacteria bacterium]HJP05801.1 MBL fold metallo-hydrolase [Gammaproteobacteria bacterium]